MPAVTETTRRNPDWGDTRFHDDNAGTTPAAMRKLRSMADIRAFLASGQATQRKIQERAAAYRFIRDTLHRFAYSHRDREDRGTLRQYLMVVTGFSRSQTTRLIGQYLKQGSIRDHRRAPARPFPKRYTDADVIALADLDVLHGQLSGPIARKLCQRAWHTFGERRFRRLATISNGHLYNLRRSADYQRRRGTASNAWWQRMPAGGACRRWSDGRPGRLYVGLRRGADPGDFCGLHLVDIVDAETKYRFIGLLPCTDPDCLSSLLRALCSALPFPLRSLHADSRREAVSKQIAESLNQLLWAATAADNAAPVCAGRCGHWPDQVNDFTGRVLSPYLNHHRLRMFAVEHAAAGGKVRKAYPYDAIATPYERLRSLPNAACYLKPGLDFRQLDAIAHAQSDNQAARHVNAASNRLRPLNAQAQTTVA